MCMRGRIVVDFENRWLEGFGDLYFTSKQLYAVSSTGGMKTFERMASSTGVLETAAMLANLRRSRKKCLMRSIRKAS